MNDHHSTIATITKYRIDGEYQACWDLAITTVSEVPQEMTMQWYFELSIAAYYLRKLSEGFEYCDRVLRASNNAMEYLPTLRNLKFYIQPIIGTQIREDIRQYYPELSEVFEGSSVSCSSGSRGSTANSYNTILRCYRTINYRMNNEPSRRVAGRQTADIVRTRNFLVHGQDTVQELIAPEWMIPYPDSPVIGLEDVRIFGMRQFTCTSRTHHPQHIPKICYGEYNEQGIVHTLVKVSYADDTVCEKNMLPFVWQGSPHVLYLELDQLMIMSINESSGKLEVVKEVPLANCRHLRGSASPTPYRDGWLFTAHETLYREDRTRAYYHRILWLNKDFTEVRQGPIFNFTGKDIEFNLGIHYDQQTEEVVLYYSSDDSNAHQLRVPLDSPWLP
jgi:hypothetical protein